MQGHSFIIHIHGSGGSGKSTLVWKAFALIGISSVTTSTPKKIHSERFESSNFRDKHLVRVNDKEGKKLKFSQLNSLSGGELVIGELKYKQFPPNCVVLLVTNDPLQLDDTSAATKRRYRPFPINRIPEKQENLKKWDGEGWNGLFAEQVGAFAYYLLEKYTDEKVGKLLKMLNRICHLFKVNLNKYLKIVTLWLDL